MNIIGHEKIIKYFKQVVKNQRLAHAYLFVGPGNIGKFTIARWLIEKLLFDSEEKINTQINTEKNTEQHRIWERPNADVVWLKREEGKKEIPIESVRKLRTRISQKPLLFSHKIVVVENVEDLSIPAVNALLKTLEEPAGRSLLILTAENLYRIPETIFSRCQIIKFKKVPLAEIERGLKRKLADFRGRKKVGSQLNTNQIREISLLAAGRPGLAIQWLADQTSYKDRLDQAQEFIDLISNGLVSRFEYIENILSKNKSLNLQIDRALNYLQDWQKIVRDLMLLKSKLPDKITYGQMEPELVKISKEYSISEFHNWLKNIESTRDLLRQNVNPRLALENLMLSIQI